MGQKIGHEIRRVAVVFLGCLLLAVAYNMVFDPNGMVTGGVSGLGIVIKEWSRSFVPGGIPLWFSTLVLNVPIFLAARVVRGRKFVLDSLVGTLLMSLALYLVPGVDILEGDRILAGIFGGVVGGAGCALVLMSSASTGGTDMLGLVIARFLPGQNVANIIGVLDGCIVLLGVFVFGIPSAMYAVLAVFLMSRVVDLVLTGQRDARMVYCISRKNEEIAQAVMKNVDRGVSKIDITGMYTGEDRDMLLCVVGRRQIIPVKKIIRSLDPRAFVIVSSVNDVRGEGFLEDILEN